MNPNEATPELAHRMRQVDIGRAVASIVSDGVLACELLDVAINGSQFNVGVIAIAAVGSLQGLPVFKRMFERAFPWRQVDAP